MEQAELSPPGQGSADLLQNVSQDITMWSWSTILSSGEISVAMGNSTTGVTPLQAAKARGESMPSFGVGVNRNYLPLCDTSGQPDSQRGAV